MQNIHSITTDHGYLTISKDLLRKLNDNNREQEGELEAFLKILLKANYSETVYNGHQSKPIICKRGESIRTYKSWSRILNWSKSKTFRFFQQLKDNGWIEIIPHDTNTSALHIRIIDYEKWVGTSDAAKPKKKAVNEKFNIFWEQYHDITRLPKENIAKAQREWKKLSDNEQQLAIDHIEEYYMHVNNVNFILLACSYLANKAFLNEYLY